MAHGNNFAFVILANEDLYRSSYASCSACSLAFSFLEPICIIKKVIDIKNTVLMNISNDGSAQHIADMMTNGIWQHANNGIKELN